MRLGLEWAPREHKRGDRLEREQDRRLPPYAEKVHPREGVAISRKLLRPPGGAADQRTCNITIAETACAPFASP